MMGDHKFQMFMVFLSDTKTMLSIFYFFKWVF